MKGCVFEDENELFVGITAELNKVSRDGLEPVFQEWSLRLARRINTKGEYVDEIEPNGFIGISRRLAEATWSNFLPHLLPSYCFLRLDIN
jgi:hypothetical protein